MVSKLPPVAVNSNPIAEAYPVILPKSGPIASKSSDPADLPLPLSMKCDSNEVKPRKCHNCYLMFGNYCEKKYRLICLSGCDGLI